MAKVIVQGNQFQSVLKGVTTYKDKSVKKHRSCGHCGLQEMRRHSQVKKFFLFKSVIKLDLPIKEYRDW